MHAHHLCRTKRQLRHVARRCDGTLTCGECPVAQTCGAAGPNLCGEGECTPTTCVQAGAECGNLSDGCGNILDCGGCPSGETCGALTTNQCDVVCVPTTCGEQNAACGTISDGCSATSIAAVAQPVKRAAPMYPINVVKAPVCPPPAPPKVRNAAAFPMAAAPPSIAVTVARVQCAVR